MNPSSHPVGANVPSDLAKARHAEDALRDSEERYRSLLDSTPVAIWEEDFTAVAAWFGRLRAEGIANLREYFQINPLAARTALDLVRIRRINQEAVIQNGAQSKQELLSALQNVFTDRSYAMWCEELSQLWEGKRLIELETVSLRLDGTEAELLMRLHVPGPAHDPRWSQVIVTGTDITARRRIERELQKSQARLAVAQRQAKLGVWDYDLTNGSVWWSDELYLLFGEDRDAFTPTVDGFLTRVPTEERESVRSAIEHSLIGDVPYRIQHRIIRKDGAVLWLDTVGTVVRDDAGHPLRMWGTSQDITERKRAQEKLLTSEAFLNATGAMAKVGGWQLDVASNALRWTNGTFRIHELPTGIEPELTDAIAFYPPEERPRLIDLLRAAKDNAEPFDAEFTFVTARGNARWVHILCTPQVRDGVVVRLTGTFQDITSRKHAEERLRESDERYRMAIRATNDAIYDIDLITRYVYWSEHYATAFGRPADSGNSWAWWIDRIHPEDRDRAVDSLRAVIKGQGNFWSSDYRFQLPSGAWAAINDRAYIARDETGKARRVVGAMQDVTARRAAEAQREALEASMRDAQKLESLGVLAGGIAHDFNNLLTTILGYADLAAEQLPTSSPAQAYLQKIERSSRRAADLCQQMLAYAGKGKVLVGPIDLGELVRESEDLLRISFAKKASLALELAPNLPAIEADASQIRQVVMNLAMNAAEAVDEERGIVRLATSVKPMTRDELDRQLLGDACREGLYVCLDVEDNGCGIHADDLARIFEPFYSTKFTGRGLGLAAVLGIVRGHSGALRVQSDVGTGTKFRILIPALDFVAPASQSEAPISWRGMGAALVADDERNVRQMATTMLDALGFTPFEAADGREAIERFLQHGPEEFAVALLDMTMPGIDGKDVYDELTRLAPKLPIVIMSGYARTEVESLFNDRRPAAYLQKPFTKRDLAEKLRAVFDPAGDL